MDEMNGTRLGHNGNKVILIRAHEPRHPQAWTYFAEILAEENRLAHAARQRSARPPSPANSEDAVYPRERTRAPPRPAAPSASSASGSSARRTADSSTQTTDPDSEQETHARGKQKGKQKATEPEEPLRQTRSTSSQDYIHRFSASAPREDKGKQKASGEAFSSRESSQSNSASEDEHEGTPPSDYESAVSNTEWQRAADLEESIRKMRELERDRPLWEKARRERERREERESRFRSAGQDERGLRDELEESIRRMASMRIDEDRDRARRERRAEAERIRREQEEEANRRQAEDAARQRAEREREEAERRAAEERRERAAREAAQATEASRRQAHERAAREARIRLRQLDFDRFPHMQGRRWTSFDALERYGIVCEDFDNATFSVTQPLVTEAIPWPVFENPRSLVADLIEWGDVEAFFKFAWSCMSELEYQSFVEKSHRRFHPDRWRRRLNTVAGEGEMARLEQAANKIAQALTPIWEKSRDGLPP